MSPPDPVGSAIGNQPHSQDSAELPASLVSTASASPETNLASEANPSTPVDLPSAQASMPSSDSMPAFVSDQVESARRFFLNLMPDHETALSVVCGGVETVQPDYEIAREDFPYFGMEIVVEGEGEVTLDGKPYPLSSGTVFVYGPGVSHHIKTDCQNVLRKYFIDFVGTDASKLLKAADLDDRVPIRIGVIHELISVMEMIIQESVHDSKVARDISQTLLRLLLLKVEKLHHSDGGDRSKAFETFHRVRHYIELNCLSVNTIEEIARQCEVTPVYLSRLFNRFSECGAYQYLLRLKMNHAAGLLLNESMLVRDVAEQLGFTDPFQFSRAFKRVYGVPPKQLIDSRK